MSIKWLDVLDIAIELSEKHEDVDPRFVNFVDWVCQLVSTPIFNAMDFTFAVSD